MRDLFRWKLHPAHLAPILMLVFLSACNGNNVATGIVDNRLMPCPESPNCVSSDASDDVHGIAPYRLKAAPDVAWEGLKNAVGSLERVTLVTVEDQYLHAEVRSALFRFVDDVEFHLRPDQGIIAVRSAARTGYGDMGVNRKRVERIRDELRSRGLVD